VLSADDLRFFLQVARRGRLVAAAEPLGVDHTTVSRRVSRLERELGRRLFHRTATGWTLTDAGRRLLPHAEAVDAAVHAAASEEAPDAQGRLAGTVRIATPEGFGAFLLVPGLGALRTRHPELTVQVVTSTQSVPLGTREFDVAVTVDEPVSRQLHHRVLTPYQLRLYATPGYLAGHPPVRGRADLREHSLIWYVDDLLDVAPLRMLNEVLPGQPVAVQSNAVSAHWQAAAAGLGVALLHRYVGDQDPRLVPVLPDQVTVDRRYWLAVPRELLRHQRVRAVCDLLDELVTARRHLLTG
jgi:DNA-binding transcriptional LysR family regulator